MLYDWAGKGRQDRFGLLFAIPAPSLILSVPTSRPSRRPTSTGVLESWTPAGAGRVLAARVACLLVPFRIRGPLPIFWRVFCYRGHCTNLHDNYTSKSH